jgi:FKBP-type peptidyl-prolyl cis-trans isomerase SlyD
MNITAPCVVSLVWRLEDSQGDLIDELKDPVEFFFGGDDLLAKVEEALTDQTIGFAAKLHLQPEQAFGDYRPELVFFEERAVLKEPIEVGMQFDGVPPGAVTQGMPADAVYNVTEVYPTHVVLDGNHPLAGVALRLALKVVAVREATPQEAAARSVDQPVFTVMNTVPPGHPIH